MSEQTQIRPAEADSKEYALWFLDELVPVKGVNNLCVAFQADAELDDAALQDTLDLLVRRHEALRTVFRVDEAGLIREVLAPDDLGVVVERRKAAAGELDGLAAEFAARSFETDGRPLLRAARFRCPDGDAFCLSVHHLIFDTISGSIFLEEFIAGYSALAAGREPPSGLLAEQPRYVEPAPRAASLDFWRRQLAGADPSTLDLWCGNADPPKPTLSGDQVTRELSAEATAVLRRAQKELRAPEAAVLLAVYCLLLARHGAGPDVIVGTPVNIRGREAPRAIGYHVNTVPLRVPVDFGRSFRELVRTARDAFLGAVGHADVPVDLLLPELREGAGASWRNAVFRHQFNYVPGGGPDTFPVAGATARRFHAENGYSKFDLEFFIVSSPGRVLLRAMYYTDILAREDARALTERFEQLLLDAAADPDRPTGEIPVMSAADRAVIDAANDTGRPLRAPTVLEAIRDQAARVPSRIAIEDGPVTATYGQLWRTAERARDQLVRAGIKAGDIVAVAAPRGPDLAAATLGAWLAGAAYLPIDPEHPAQRLAYLLEDSGAAAVLAAPGVVLPGEAVLRVLPLEPVTAEAPDAPPAVFAPDPGSCAYLIYTSGSTGRPKGTLISHRALANVVFHFADELAAGPGDSMLWLTTFSFDISVLEVFMPLVSGGRVTVAPDAARTDGEALLEQVTRQDIGIIQATPTTWRILAEAASTELAGRRLLCGGEPLPLTLARTLTALCGGEVLHVYGPSENTVWSTAGPVPPEVAEEDVGRPLANTQVFVTDPGGRELPVGVQGELCIAGDGVAIGYHDRPELTAERFGEHPRYGRYYHTGDRARWRPDGKIELAGRLDRQIKLRGNRIELGEIEAVLLERPEVQAAAVVVTGEGAEAVLVAFLDAAPGTDTRPLLAYARAQLPTVAVPQELTVLRPLPVTANEKTDYLALARLAEQHRAERAQVARGTAAPAEDGLTGQLLALWRATLSRADIGPDASFFDSGGHSLLGAQLVQRVEKATGHDVRLADLFDHPTPRAMAEYLAGSGR